MPGTGGGSTSARRCPAYQTCRWATTSAGWPPRCWQTSRSSTDRPSRSSAASGWGWWRYRSRWRCAARGDAASGMTLSTFGSVGAVLATAHTAANLRQLRTPPTDPPVGTERVSVLLPVRDEAYRVTDCLRSLLAQQRVAELELLVLDDGSTDATAAIVRREAGADPRLRLLTGAPLPSGWLGKPHACAQLAAAATGTVLVFLDADVVLAPTAIAATVALLRTTGLDVLSPYPRQLANGPVPRLVQPLLQWSWLTFLPLRRAERSPRASLAAANGRK